MIPIETFIIIQRILKNLSRNALSDSALIKQPLAELRARTIMDQASCDQGLLTARGLKWSVMAKHGETSHCRCKIDIDKQTELEIVQINKEMRKVNCFCTFLKANKHP